jgi:hypothetical protein
MEFLPPLSNVFACTTSFHVFIAEKLEQKVFEALKSFTTRGENEVQIIDFESEFALRVAMLLVRNTLEPRIEYYACTRLQL